MKLKKLYIEYYKNLNKITLDFFNTDGITILIGNNGSGKSNIIEAISIIFMELKTKKNEYTIDYTLEYEIENKQIKIERYNGDYNFLIDDIENTTISQDYLPTKVIASYSGESYRLWNIYEEQYYDNSRKKISLQDKPFVYINLDDVDIHILSTIYNEIYEIYINNNVEEIKQLKEKYKNLNIKIDLNSHHKKLVKNEKLMLFINQITNDEIKITFNSLLSYYNSNLPNEKQDFLKYLLNCNSRKLINEFVLEEVYELSEGEKKLKIIELIFELLAEKNTLILLDEPDAHIHIANKKLLKQLAYKNNEIDNEIIISTHSPTLTHHFDDKHIIMLNDGKVEDKTKQEIFSHITNGIWNYQEQSIFLSSRKEIILLVEGKHDKIHIEEAFKRLKDNYNDLDFDIFSVEGADNIKQLLVGIKSLFKMSDKSKKYIGIFDCDNKGKEIVGNKAKRKKYASLGKSKNFYYLYLPFDDYEKDFEIENMYPEYRLQKAYKKAIDIITTNINKDSIEKEAKNQLSIMCKDFNTDTDFKYFKKLFDLILEITRQDNGDT